MEHGRVAHLTLHAAPPRPCTPEQPIGMVLANTLLPDGTTTLRLLLLPALVPPPLPLTRVGDDQVRGGEGAPVPLCPPPTNCWGLCECMPGSFLTFFDSPPHLQPACFGGSMCSVKGLG